MRLNVLAKSSDEDFLPSPMAPFQPLSEAGLFLSQLLQTNPDLIPSAVEHELERLSGNRDAESCQLSGSPGSASDQDLYRFATFCLVFSSGQKCMTICSFFSSHAINMKRDQRIIVLLFQYMNRKHYPDH
jgi:hypothetical protein